MSEVTSAETLQKPVGDYINVPADKYAEHLEDWHTESHLFREDEREIAEVILRALSGHSYVGCIALLRKCEVALAQGTIVL